MTVVLLQGAQEESEINATNATDQGILREIVKKLKTTVIVVMVLDTLQENVLICLLKGTHPLLGMLQGLMVRIPDTAPPILAIIAQNPAILHETVLRAIVSAMFVTSLAISAVTAQMKTTAVVVVVIAVLQDPVTIALNQVISPVNAPRTTGSAMYVTKVVTSAVIAHRTKDSQIQVALRCEGAGHIARNCPKCFSCGKFGHVARDCETAI